MGKITLISLALLATWAVYTVKHRDPEDFSIGDLIFDGLLTFAFIWGPLTLIGAMFFGVDITSADPGIDISCGQCE